MDHVARLETLYRDVGPSLLGYLRRRCPDGHAAEDWLQETFHQAARRPDRLARAASPRAWLFAIARNVLATAQRRSRASASLPPELSAAETEEDPRLEGVRNALEALPETLREALELRLRGELSYEEIAGVLEIPVGTVRSRLHNALRRLRVELVDEES